LQLVEFFFRLLEIDQNSERLYAAGKVVKGAANVLWGTSRGCDGMPSVMEAKGGAGTRQDQWPSVREARAATEENADG
jgi:hypothetical protein